MNKKKLYESIIESISKLVKKAINETIDFNTSNIFNKEESFYDYNEKDSIVYRTIENKILNDLPITIEESIYYFKINDEIPKIILNKLLIGKTVSNEIMRGISISKVKYKINSKNELKEIIKIYSNINPTASLNWIDTSLITDMSELFRATKYNGDISEWDVSNVNDMSYMFYANIKFNQHIGNWNVSNVISMASMFSYASSFNQPIGNWDVSNVKNMCNMFNEAKSFNQFIRDWDVRNVIYMFGMFYNAWEFNQPIGDWNVSNVKNMDYMFYNAISFNQDISNWNLKNIINFINMFYKCHIKEEYKPKIIKNL